MDLTSRPGHASAHRAIIVDGEEIDEPFGAAVEALILHGIYVRPLVAALAYASVASLEIGLKEFHAMAVDADIADISPVARPTPASAGLIGRLSKDIEMVLDGASVASPIPAARQIFRPELLVEEVVLEGLDADIPSLRGILILKKFAGFHPLPLDSVEFI